jgi:hypothetical protein
MAEARMAYDPKVAARLLDHVSCGGSVSEFCRKKGNPTKTTIMRWLRANPDFQEAMAEAREWMAESFVDEIVTIADDEKLPADSRRVRIHAREKAAAMQAPKKYGAKIQLGGAVKVEQPDIREVTEALRGILDHF